MVHILRPCSLPRAGEMSQQSWGLKSHAQLQSVWQEGHVCPDLPLSGPVFARYVGGGERERDWLLSCSSCACDSPATGG